MYLVVSSIITTDIALNSFLVYESEYIRISNFSNIFIYTYMCVSYTCTCI